MSWIFGIYGNISVELIGKSKLLHESTENIVYNNNYYIACGGMEGTYHFYNSNQNNILSGIAVCGTGFSNSNNQYKLLNKKDWYDLFKNNKSGSSNIDGHFCGVHWDDSKVNVFTDAAGVYDIYYFESRDLIYFSTDVFLLNTLIDNSEIEMEVFASRWLCINQMSEGSIIKNIKRLCRSRLLIDKNRISIVPYKKIKMENPTQKNLGNELSSLLGSVFNSGFDISLSLSGGMDSRLLLSLLTSLGEKNFSLHTFGHPDYQDSVIASKIAKDLNINHQQFYSLVTEKSECIELISDYIKNTMCINPCSTAFQLRYYPLLYKKNTIIVDGGFGELGRRYYLNRILYGNKKIILNGIADKIFEYLKFKHADIFSEVINKEMINDSIQDISNLISEIPDANQIGAENWADMFSYITRLPNSHGIEQKRMNNYVINLMPFCFKSVFEIIINTKVKDRNDRKAYKKIISQNNPALTKYPLVSGNILYPFSSGTIKSKLFLASKKFRKKNSELPSDYYYLENVKEFVLDLLNSESVKNYDLYDHKKISENVNKYYKGDSGLAAYTDWWLSFEILRRKIYRINF
ncbi:MAG: asparagine synthase-related protein [bacterium]